MIFTSVTFVVFFTILYGLLLTFRGNRSRIHILLVASLIFYGWWNVAYLVLIFFINAVGWLVGVLIDDARSQRGRKAFMVAGLVVTLCILGYFKYAAFIVNSFSLLFGGTQTSFDILLPLGISFHTFQTMSYIIDVYRKDIEVCRSFVKFSLFATFFPQLVAGPIVRAVDFLPQLEVPIVLTRENFLRGSQLFLGGALQKIVVADNVSRFVDAVYAKPELYTSETLWLCVFAYSLQIFCDFAGYSLMAIGIARILGFELPKNFDMPYTAMSIVDFWRRWHISLSTWLRDYLYISLGGNRCSPARRKLNLLLTMLLGGLWHGASWNFVLWGGLHGLALAFNQYWVATARRPLADVLGEKVYSVAAWLVTFLFVSLAWIPFRSPSWSTTLTFFRRLAHTDDGMRWLHTPTCVALCGALVWHLAYRFAPRWLALFPADRLAARSASRMFVLVAGVYLLILFAPLNASPFIYFQF